MHLSPRSSQPQQPKPLASLSLDLDNQWSYMKIHGDPGWESLPSYLDVVVPRALDFLWQRQLTITFFVVGQDVAEEKNQAAIASISQAGHEIGNHSFHHESWLHLYNEAEIEQEIALTETYLKRVTGQKPVGFRGPGYSFSPAVLRVLARRGYHYDASTFPTYLGPLARAYYFMTAKLTPEEREKRKALFGGFRDGFQSLKPYRWQPEGLPSVVEIPVTTLPIVKIPIHFSYILYLAVFSPTLALLYFRFAMGLCRLMGIQPSLLMHPLDFLDRSDVPALGFFPGMNLAWEKKLQILDRALDAMQRHFTLVPMGHHAQVIAASRLPSVAPRPRPLDEAIAWH